MSSGHADELVAGFARRVAGAADAPVLEGAARTASAADVARLATDLAARLRRRGLRRGTVFALRAVNGTGFLAGLLALRREGLVALLLDAQTPEDTEDRIVRTLGAAGVLRCGDAWPGSARSVEIADAEGDRAAVVPSAAVLKLTSGSTGEPAGVVTPGSCLLADVAALHRSMSLRPDERYLATVPFSHSYGLSSLVAPALIHRAVLVIPGEDAAARPLAVARTARATVFPTTPALLRALTRMDDATPWPDSLGTVLSAGAPLSPAVARQFADRFGRRPHVFYGASECGGICYDRSGEGSLRGSVGTPVDGVRIELASDPGADSDRGLVTVRSPAVAAGYHPTPRPTLRGGVFRTSDLARRDGGEIVLVGRTSEVINIRGRKVHPGEVERVLASLAGVDEVVVVGHEAAGGVETVRAVIACADGALSYLDVLRHCRGRLAGYQTPRSILLVRSIPRNARGKIDRDALEALAPAPPGAERGQHTSRV